MRRPASRSWEECAAYPLASLTAYRMLRRARLQAGQTVLVVGIGSGVSCAALAIARHLGAEVVVTSRSEAKRAEALAMGAAAALRLGRRALAGRRPTSSSRASARRRGTGRSAPSRPAAGSSCAAGRPAPTVELNLPRLFFKQYEIIGSSMGSYQEFAELTALVDQGLDVHIDQVLPLADYPAALARLEAGDQLGKIVLRH